MSLKLTNTLEEEFGDLLGYLLKFYPKERLQEYMNTVNNLRSKGVDIS